MRPSPATAPPPGHQTCGRGQDLEAPAVIVKLGGTTITAGKVVAFLVANYDVILLPSFETQHMVARGGKRVLTSKSARALLTWSHYRFKQRLLFKRQEYPWCKVLVVNEAYTTKTCGRCGALHHNIGGAKRFVCPTCTTTLDRDANAARNILLKNSSLFGFAAAEALGLTPSPSTAGSAESTTS